MGARRDPRQALVRRGEVRRLAVVLVVLVLVAAAVNVPFAVTRIRPRSVRVPNLGQLRGDDAAAHGWPAAPAHAARWPPPHQIDIDGVFGYRSFNVFGRDEGEDGQRFQMEVQRMGWPIGVLERKLMWWDWNDPSLQGPDPNPEMYLRPVGLLLNPPIVGGGVFVLLFGPVAAFVIGRRAWRRRGGACGWCGHPVGDGGRCVECGEGVGGRGGEGGSA